ncbi:hypothetical protein [Desulfatibacillum aliphaticivorans]|uniref:hypothetical protein n=1 Tax=Desulfatibacillum aliphaticivorans TaxID=218208 RepID=UPI00016022F3|nr:hypothetical protein [Desulfatibacillum aliphaticivorans]
MKQILQSYKSGELWLADVPVPMCGSNGIVVQTQNSFVSAGTKKMLGDFARKNLLGKALAMPDQVKKVIRKMKTEGIFFNPGKSSDQTGPAYPAWVFQRWGY